MQKRRNEYKPRIYQMRPNSYVICSSHLEQKRLEGDHRIQWQHIGSWTTDGHHYTFTGHIPKWMKDQIGSLGSKLGERKLNRCRNLRQGQKLIDDAMVYTGCVYLRGKNFVNKITYDDGDTYISGDVYTSPMFTHNK